MAYQMDLNSADNTLLMAETHVYLEDAEVLAVRKYFPETWLWKLTVSGYEYILERKKRRIHWSG